jgi:hypothetical protein
MNPVTYLEQWRIFGYGLIAFGVIILVLLLILVSRVGRSDRRR